MGHGDMNLGYFAGYRTNDTRYGMNHIDGCIMIQNLLHIISVPHLQDEDVVLSIVLCLINKTLKHIIMN